MTSVSERARVLLAAGLACTLLMTSVARAEPRPGERETARTLLISGREKRKAGDLNGALGDFYRAHGIMHVPTTGLDLGRAQAELGLMVEARNTLLDTAKIPVKPRESAAFGRAREEAKRLADEIARRLATVTVTIKGVPARAKVMISVDGADNSAAQRGVPFKINPGKREIAATHGESRDSKRVEIPEGGSQAIELTLVASAEASGEVDLDAPPAEKSPTPPPPLEDKPTDDAPPGESRDGAAPRTRTNPLVFVGGGAAVVGVAVGTVTGLISMSIYSSVEPMCPKGLCPPATHADIDRGVALSVVATGAFILAGAGAALCVYGLLTPRADAAKNTGNTGIIVLPTPLGVVGRF